ncbi:MAG TPA: UPF0182 family protein [Gemmatimonadales bacterium]|nr:UPF0182 family protein [Gemmatimonadales bacterium]HRZ08774.1 UPF0182 family protein [Gemmatimonadales bacterium]
MRGRWLVGTAAALVVLLFAGQWLADLLADRWWAGALIPEAAGFVSGVHLLRLTLDAAAVLVGTAWFTGHLLVVHRAIGSVQISRQVANLEIREAVTPATLLPLALALGVTLGLVTGLGSGRDWPAFALAWQGVTYGVSDPYLNRDLGVFVGQLPLWLLLHAFTRLLLWSALLVVAALYVALGALRWQHGRPAITDHARRHLGFLLAGCALALAWGCLLAPFEAAASGAPPAAEWSTLELSTLALAGAGLAAAAISAHWAVRGQHLLMVAGWGVLLAGALVVDLVRSGEVAPPDDAQASARMGLDRIAYGLDRLDDNPRAPASMPGPGVPSLWSWPSIGRLVTADSQVLEAAAPTTIAAGGEAVPVWLVVRAARSGQASVLAIADGRVGPAAAPLSYRAGDSLAYPGLVTYATLGRAAIHPGAPRLLVDSGPNGLAVGGLGRRVVLAWALQAPRLLGASAPEARVRWHLGPRSRLERLAPFASWEAPRLLVLGGSFVWIAHGYLASATFPGSTRITEAAGTIGALEAGLLGTVDAATGATTIYLLPDAGPLTRSWAAISQGVVRPTGELPAPLALMAPYPPRLFDAQSRILESPAWRVGTLAGRVAETPGEPAPPTVVWEGGHRQALMAAYERGDAPRVRVLLLGRATDAGRRLALLRLGDDESLPGPAAAQALWDRFPSYEQLLDSVARSGSRFERGPYRVLPTAGAPVAYQPWYAFDPDGRVAQPYVSVAQGDRAGAGRSFADAWQNLRGEGAPLPPGFGPRTQLEEARLWMMRADSALRAGDWEGFGRAFGALRQALGGGRAE